MESYLTEEPGFHVSATCHMVCEETTLQWEINSHLNPFSVSGAYEDSTGQLLLGLPTLVHQDK